jgi:hypothetical protein
VNRTLASSVVAVSLVAVGCMSSSPPPSTMATTVPVAQSPVTPPASPGPAPPPPTVTAGQATRQPAAASTLPPEKDMTHSFTKDTPYFVDKPAAGATPAGTFKAGTKVIVLVPGAPYAKVQSLDGVVAYASIDDLEPLGK